MKPMSLSIPAFLVCWILWSLCNSLLTGKEWTTKITTEESSLVFGGSLLADEKPWVGKWQGINDNMDSWKILRRPNHVYTIEIHWKEDGDRMSFYGHGLWAVKNGKFYYCDVLDEEMETLQDWPVEVKKMIHHEDYVMGIEKIKSVGIDKIVTSTDQSGDSVEKRVETFEKGWIIAYDKPNPIKEKQLFDQVVLARIRNQSDMVDFFTDPAYSVPKKLEGYWKISSDDPDDVDPPYEIIRRSDGTNTSIFEDEEGKQLLSHSLWTIRNGLYYEAEIVAGDKVVSFEDGYLFSEKVVSVGNDGLVTQWVDPERKRLIVFPLVVTVNEQRIKQFKSKLLVEETKKKTFGLKLLLGKIKEAEAGK